MNNTKLQLSKEVIELLALINETPETVESRIWEYTDVENVIMVNPDHDDVSLAKQVYKCLIEGYNPVTIVTEEQYAKMPKTNLGLWWLESQTYLEAIRIIVIFKPDISEEDYKKEIKRLENEGYLIVAEWEFREDYDYSGMGASMWRHSENADFMFVGWDD